MDEMHDRSEQAKVITYNFLLHALCKNHHIDKATELFLLLISSMHFLVVITFLFL